MSPNLVVFWVLNLPAILNYRTSRCGVDTCLEVRPAFLEVHPLGVRISTIAICQKIKVASLNRQVVRNHRQLHCMLNNLVKLTTEKHQHQHYWHFVRKINEWPAKSPHKGPVMWETLSCPDDILRFISCSQVFISIYLYISIYIYIYLYLYIYVYQWTHCGHLVT